VRLPEMPSKWVGRAAGDVAPGHRRCT
jgi:hypothetical protein